MTRARFVEALLALGFTVEEAEAEARRVRVRLTAKERRAVASEAASRLKALGVAA